MIGGEAVSGVGVRKCESTRRVLIGIDGDEIRAELRIYRPAGAARVLATRCVKHSY